MTTPPPAPSAASSPPGPADVQVTFAATLVDECVRAGLTDAVLCPGSRSTPLALALADAADGGRLRLHVHHDERSGAFLALGIGLGTGRPAVVLTTSGTAAAELHPAVVEADLAAVPLLACTADRPTELRDVGAPQAIDQVHLAALERRDAPADRCRRPDVQHDLGRQPELAEPGGDRPRARSDAVERE